VLGRIGPVDEFRHRRKEVVGHGAADAAVGEFDDVVLGAALDPAALQDVAVDADVAELVDDDGEAATVRLLQQAADEGGLARAQEAGDDGGGDLGHAHLQRGADDA